MSVNASQAQSGGYNPDIRIANFSGGRVNVPQVKGEAQLQSNQLARSINIDTSGGSQRKMKGFEKRYSTELNGDVSSLWYDFKTSSVYMAYGTKLAHTVAGVITDLSASSYTDNSIWSFNRIVDLILMCNGVDAAKTYDAVANTVAAVTTPPATWAAAPPLRAVSWNGRAFAFQSNSDILYYSKLRDVMTWTAGANADSAGAMAIGDDGKPIKAIIPLTSGLLIFKDPGLYYFTGVAKTTGTLATSGFDQTTFDWQVIAPMVDCLGSRSAIAVDRAVYSWGRTGVYKIEGSETSGKVNITLVSNNIAYDVNNVTLRHEEVCAVHYAERRQIWFGVATNNGSTGIDAVHCYDYANLDNEGIGGWMLRTGYQHKCMANVIDPDTNKVSIWSGSYENGSGKGFVHKQNVTTDWDGLPMETFAYSYWLPLGIAAKGKSNRAVFMLGQQTAGTITYNYAYDFNVERYEGGFITPDDLQSTWVSTAPPEWGEEAGGGVGTWSSAPAFIFDIPIYGGGRRMQHRFYSNEVGVDFDILEILHPVTTLGYA